MQLLTRECKIKDKRKGSLRIKIKLKYQPNQYLQKDDLNAITAINGIQIEQLL